MLLWARCLFRWNSAVQAWQEEKKVNKINHNLKRNCVGFKGTISPRNTNTHTHLLFVALKWDLAMTRFTTFGVTVLIFHFNSRLCSTGRSSTAGTQTHKRQVRLREHRNTRGTKEDTRWRSEAVRFILVSEAANQRSCRSHGSFAQRQSWPFSLAVLK